MTKYAKNVVRMCKMLKKTCWNGQRGSSSMFTWRKWLKNNCTGLATVNT